ncbi:MAG TPA: ATP-binding protein, partial [Verrucomicrobiales bacterium]|nr:ATP-binding protein [Verrucomicrobiales bacterium]
MSAAPASGVRLFRMMLKQDPDVVLCRNRARMVAEKLEFVRQDQIRVATAVSEIARNAFRYAKGASAEFFLEATAKSEIQRMVCVIRDEGPGIPNLEEIMSGHYKSQTGMGMGIAGAYRLMDNVTVETGPRGTTVHLSKIVPRKKPFSPAEVQTIADSILGPGKASPLGDLADQNNEVLFMLQEVNVKGKELTRVNEELSETNRGVVALYDELDTVYRVGHVLAAKLELHELLEAIINATTEISGAELGIFVYEEQEGADGAQPSAQQHWAGPLAGSLRKDVSFPLDRLLGSTSRSPDILRIDDLEKGSRVPVPLDEAVPLRSYLAIPVLTMSGELSGAMVFAHRQPSMFSERSERILSSVALQSTIGIQNARLYKSVRSSSAAKDHFLATLSHELRNPLNPVFMRLSLLEENAAMPADALEDVRLIRRNLELETRLIDDLLDITRIARGKISMKPEPMNLHDVIDAAREACSGSADERGVRIILELEAPAFLLMGDAVRLQQVFWNLLNNAVKFSSPGSEVH